ncbi:potassium-transporting ATPase subunit KdpC [Parvibaculum sedimenti]|uniref:Potassium-transporting ATPase KdpC subunit n=1 Tax=Parvibaculum sedimenti TaxID=2608632 RepID=A0A6N6VIF5_9HYPH|nr:potassium-transporting ATPase subunit KdpC [Parvibaculum sedimenti]KAB7739536.1 potassium-transporting ATPase subunit KdpC [Parvibaculum sedimenti]
MLKDIRPAIVLLALFTLLLGLAYPLGMTRVAGALFPHQAEGSLIEKNGIVIGSEIIGQTFTGEKYFHGRPSATTGTDDKGNSIALPNNAANSMGSNLGPTNKALIERIKNEVEKLKAENPNAAIPVDMVTTSASGFDPDITPAAALFQMPRVAKARNLDPAKVEALINQFTKPRTLGIIGEPAVNVLKLNMALDSEAVK